jgi:hypothetical protein
MNSKLVGRIPPLTRSEQALRVSGVELSKPVFVVSLVGTSHEPRPCQK